MGNEVIANSITDFSGAEQGLGGWYYGFYDRSGDADRSYDPTSDFQPLPTADGRWWSISENYWTVIGELYVHPNGVETTAPRRSAEHWPIRRWVSDVEGLIQVRGRVAKSTTSVQSDGVEAEVLVDGRSIYSVALDASDGVGTQFEHLVNVIEGQPIDFILKPIVADAGDGTDYSAEIILLEDLGDAGGANPPDIEPIVFIQHPTGVTLSVGESIRLSTEVSGTEPFTYSWTRNEEAILGANTAEYAVASARESDSGVYRVLVSNEVGQAMSDEAVMVVEPEALVPEPFVTRSVEGDTVLLSVTPPAGDVTYTVEETMPLGVVVSEITEGGGYDDSQRKIKWGPFFGAQSKFLSYSIAVESGGDELVVFSGASSSDGVDLPIIGVAEARFETPTKPELAIVMQPESLEVAEGSSAEFSVEVAGADSVAFQWYRGGVAINGATGSALQFESVRLLDDGNYRVVISGNGVELESDEVRLRVLELAKPEEIPVFAILKHPLSLSIDEGGTARFEVSVVSGSEIQYQWYRGDEAIAGANDAALDLVGVDETASGAYRVVVSSGGQELVSLGALLQVRRTAASDSIADVDMDVRFPESGFVKGAGSYPRSSSELYTMEAVPAERHSFYQWLNVRHRRLDWQWNSVVWSRSENPGPLEFSPVGNISAEAVILPDFDLVEEVLDLAVVGDNGGQQKMLLSADNSFVGIHKADAHVGNASLEVQNMNLSLRDSSGYMRFWAKKARGEFEQDGLLLGDDWTRNTWPRERRLSLGDGNNRERVSSTFLIDGVEFADDYLEVVFAEEYLKAYGSLIEAGASVAFDSSMNRGAGLTGPGIELSAPSARFLYYFDDVQEAVDSFPSGDYSLRGVGFEVHDAFGQEDIPVPVPVLPDGFNLWTESDGYGAEVTWEPWSNPPEGALIRVTVTDLDGEELTRVTLSPKATRASVPAADSYVVLSFLYPIHRRLAMDNEVNPRIGVDVFQAQTVRLRHVQVEGAVEFGDGLEGFEQWASARDVEAYSAEDRLPGDPISLGKRYQLGLGVDLPLALQLRTVSEEGELGVEVFFQVEEVKVDWRLERSEDLIEWSEVAGTAGAFDQFVRTESGQIQTLSYREGSDSERDTGFYRLLPVLPEVSGGARLPRVINDNVSLGGDIALEFETLDESEISQMVWYLDELPVPVAGFDLEDRQVMIRALVDPGTYRLKYEKSGVLVDTGQTILVASLEVSEIAQERFDEFAIQLESSIGVLDSLVGLAGKAQLAPGKGARLRAASEYGARLRDELNDAFSALTEAEKTQFIQYLGGVDIYFQATGVEPPFDLGSLDPDRFSGLGIVRLSNSSDDGDEVCVGGLAAWEWEDHPLAHIVWRAGLFVLRLTFS